MKRHLISVLVGRTAAVLVVHLTRRIKFLHRSVVLVSLTTAVLSVGLAARLDLVGELAAIVLIHRSHFSEFGSVPVLHLDLGSLFKHPFHRVFGDFFGGLRGLGGWVGGGGWWADVHLFGGGVSPQRWWSWLPVHAPRTRQV